MANAKCLKILKIHNCVLANLRLELDCSLETTTNWSQTNPNQDSRVKLARWRQKSLKSLYRNCYSTDCQDLKGEKF